MIPHHVLGDGLEYRLELHLLAILSLSLSCSLSLSLSPSVEQLVIIIQFISFCYKTEIFASKTMPKT